MIGASFRTALAAGLAAGWLLLPGVGGGDAAAQAQPQIQAQPQQDQAQERAQQRLRERLPSFSDVAEGLLASVVNISTSQRVTGSRGIPIPEVPEGSPFQEFFEDFFNRNQPGERTPRRVQSLGSGFVIDPQGYIVTNNHVIADADEITVNFSDGRRLVAEVIGRDPKTDLAILKVESEEPLPAANFGDSDKLRIGDWVMAIGNPFGFGGTLTVGIVSALERDINSGPYDRFIQTDASINRGNSGGPLFSLDGGVVGITTALISPTGGSIGIGFAVRPEIAVPVIRQLREFGEPRRGWLGVRIQEVTDEIAESLGMSSARGALVAGIIQGGPADNGLIQPGDVIVSFDGRAIREMRDLPRIVAESPVGQVVDVEIIRGGEQQTVQITLGRLEDSDAVAMSTDDDAPDGVEPDPSETASVLGMTITALTDELRESYDIASDVNGVVITGVEPGSIAEDRGIAVGEVIIEIAQESVSTPDEVLDRISSLSNQGRRNALLMLSNGSGELRFVTLRMD